MFKQRAGLNAVQVAYKGTQDAVNDMNNGLLDFIWSDAVFGLAQAKGGKLKILAVTSDKRSSLDPSLPTMQESGVPNYHLEAWWGAWFPRNTPRPIVDQTAKWLNEILASDEAKTFFSASAPAELFPGNPESLQSYLAADVPRWTEVLTLAKVERQ